MPRTLTACLLAILIACACSASTPPSGRMVYGVSTSSERTFRFYTADWPDPKPKALNPKIIGKYGLGDFLTEPLFSPDGSKLLFVANRVLPNGKPVEVSDYNEVGTDLWILDVKANTAKPLTVNGSGYYSATWSPNGRYVCAISDEGFVPGHPEGGAAPIDNWLQWKHNLYLWDTHTGRRSLVAKYVENAVWSADSRRMYFQAAKDYGEVNYYYADVTARKPRLFHQFPVNTWFGPCSPDGRFVALRPEAKELHLIRLSTGKTVRLAEFTHSIYPMLWSPDSREIASLMDNGYLSNNLRKEKLAVTEAATGKTRTLCDLSGEPELTNWTSDGKWLIAIRYLAPAPVFSMEVDAIPVGGGKPVKLFTSPQWTNGFTWHELPSK